MEHIFVDAQKMMKNHPETFEAPTKEELKKIKPGSFVKVCTNKERFWVEVTGVKGNKITGTVGNDLFMEGNEDLPFGIEITVDKKNVYNIMST